MSELPTPCNSCGHATPHKRLGPVKDSNGFQHEDACEECDCISDPTFVPPRPNPPCPAGSDCTNEDQTHWLAYSHAEPWSCGNVPESAVLAFCGHAVCGDRGGPAEACGNRLPCATHPARPARLSDVVGEERIRNIVTKLRTDYYASERPWVVEHACEIVKGVLNG